MPYVDLAFRLQGNSVPVDHGYALYAALSRIVPAIHEAKDIGVPPIRGVYNGDGSLHLTEYSCLIIRLPDERIRQYLPLAGKRLEIGSHAISAGVPEVRTLPLATRLRARLVTIKGFQDEEDFRQATQRQLDDLKVGGEFLIGERRTLRIKDKQVVGFELAFDGLTAEQSLILQEVGIGGRRRMGCGVFVPMSAFT
jgi:CRISPR-associated protein Cas6